MTTGRVLRRGVAALAVAALVATACTVPGQDAPFTMPDPPLTIGPRVTGPIAQGYGYGLVTDYSGAPATPNPFGSGPVQHPGLAATDANNMHADGFATETHPNGPLGSNLQIDSANMEPGFGGNCAAQAFTSQNEMVAVCGAAGGLALRVIDPQTLDILDDDFMGQRTSNEQAAWTGDTSIIFKDSSGAYFFIDDQDRIVATTAFQTIRRYTLDRSGPGVSLVLDAEWDVEPSLLERDCWTPTNQNPTGVCDVLTSVFPDYNGHYWWVSRFGVVGSVNPGTGVVQSITITGEEIENSFAVDADGAYIASDHAMYMFELDGAGVPQQVWRETYDRGTTVKVGQINQGTGTTPTLLGNDLVAIADNATQMNVVVMDRRATPAGPRTICTVPVFTPLQGATETSLIGAEDSFVVQSTAGYTSQQTLAGGKTSGGGFVKIDVAPDRSSCTVDWTNPITAPSTLSKLSTGNGLIYTYTKPDLTASGIDAWYFTALDMHTGATVWQKLVGTGFDYDNTWGVISTGPDGSGYIGVLGGLVRIWDGP